MSFLLGLFFFRGERLDFWDCSQKKLPTQSFRKDHLDALESKRLRAVGSESQQPKLGIDDGWGRPEFGVTFDSINYPFQN